MQCFFVTELWKIKLVYTTKSKAQRQITLWIYATSHSGIFNAVCLKFFFHLHLPFIHGKYLKWEKLPGMIIFSSELLKGCSTTFKGLSNRTDATNTSVSGWKNFHWLPIYLKNYTARRTKLAGTCQLLMPVFHMLVMCDSKAIF